MKKLLVALLIGGVAVAGVVSVAVFQPNRMTESERLAALEAQRQLDKAEAVEAQAAAQPEATKEPETAAAPEKSEAPAAGETTTAEPAKEGAAEVPEQNVVKVKLVTSKGDVVIELHRDWAPLGVERFVELVKTGFFNDVRFFRVVTQPRPFVVQFGIAADPAVSAQWITKRLQDEPVKQANTEGTVTFAMGGPNSRTTQLFINLGDNRNLDGMGFSPIGKVSEGMDIVRSFNSQYQEQPTRAQGQMQKLGNEWLDKEFPGLDYIKSAEIVE